MTNPWCSPDIARMMAENVDRQLAERPWPIHFTCYADAVRALSVRGTLLEAGCGVGHGYEILRRADVRVGAYAGYDINSEAIALARGRYPQAGWVVETPATPWKELGSDIVVDGSLVLHIDDWRAHLAALCAASRDAVILHRIPVSSRAATWKTQTHGYGRTFEAWSFSLPEITSAMAAHGFTHTETRKADGDSLTLTFRKGA